MKLQQLGFNERVQLCEYLLPKLDLQGAHSGCIAKYELISLVHSTLGVPWRGLRKILRPVTVCGCRNLQLFFFSFSSFSSSNT